MLHGAAKNKWAPTLCETPYSRQGHKKNKSFYIYGVYILMETLDILPKITEERMLNSVAFVICHANQETQF